MKQIALPISAGNQPSFENFVDHGNAQAVHAVQASLQGRGAPLLYLWGPRGTGKTHLLHAAINQLAANGQSSGQIGLAKSDSADPGSALPDQAFDANWAAVLLDDVHLFSAYQQQQAFAWMIHAQSLGCNVVACGAVPPVNLALRDDVRSRLAQGQVVALVPLPEAQTREVLRRAAHAKGIVLSNEVLDFVMLRFSRDLSSLHQLLDKLDTFSLEVKRSVTVPLINTMFRTMESGS